MRCIVANLDCEAELAETLGVSRYHLSQAVERRISALGTLLSVFGRPGDVLWTPAPVDPERLPAQLEVELVSGPMSALRQLCRAAPPGPPDAALALTAWGETEQVMALRRSARRALAERRWLEAASARAPAVAELSDAAPTILDELDAIVDLDGRAERDAPAPLPAVIARCNDRRFAFALQARYGYLLPGAQLIDSLAALRAHLDQLAWRRDDAWVLEAPFAASGRLRVRQRGAEIDRAIATRIERLLRRFGSLCFAPWVERVADFGCLGIIAARDRWRLLAPHRIEADHAGVFHGVTLDLGAGDDAADADAAPDCDDVDALSVPRRSPRLPAEARERAIRAAERAACALAEAGYRGPFGIDGFAYRMPGDGPDEVRWQPMCEINARLSFGLIAHAWAQRRGARTLSLGVGATMPEHAPADIELVPLLYPAADDPTAVWLAIAR
ncbi:MAG: hypothetical protein Tsb0020_28300 [Haliangiales bacterium]